MWGELVKAYRSLLKTALLHGLKFDVYDGEEEILCAGRFQEAVDAIEAVEEAWINFSDGWWAYVLPYGVADDESVADWSTSKDGEPDNWIDDWGNKYFADPRYPASGDQPVREININELHGADI